MGETGLWRTALFISPSVCMLMSLHAFMRVCVRASVCACVFAHASCAAVGAGLFIMPRVSPPCKASVIAAPSSLHRLRYRTSAPPGAATAFPRFPSRTAGVQGAPAAATQATKKKEKKSLLHLCVNGNPRDTTYFFVIFKSTKLFLSLAEGKNSCRVQQHIHDINEKDEMPPRCWCTVIMSRAPTGRATITTIYK